MSDLFGNYPGYAGASFKNDTTQSVYITMRDGVRIAADVLLPKGSNRAEKFPTLLYQTRYWRARQFMRGFGWLDRVFSAPIRFFTRHGYAVVLVDVRGTGASFGVNHHPWDPEEIKDMGELVDWIVAQPWSNGKVGGYGTSYTGTTSELLTVAQRASVPAVIARFNEFDVYTDIAFPGGVYLNAFGEQWSAYNNQLDNNRVPDSGWLGRLTRGVKPVDPKLLADAVRDHANNIPSDTVARSIECRDDRDPVYRISSEDFSVHTFRAQIEKSGAAIYSWGGWFDAGTADAVIRRFATLRNPQRAVIGAWNHGGAQHASPYAPGKADARAQGLEYLRRFDHYLKGTSDDAITARELHYFTIGEEKWKCTTEWPLRDIESQTWFLSGDRILGRAEPRDENTADEYVIDYEATTGTRNRWHTELDRRPVIYADRAEQDRRLLTYTSALLDEDMEITGYPIITLYISSTYDDGAFFVYLEDVDEHGKVIYLTEGILRAAHRKISNEPPPYTQFVPYHSFKRCDLMPLIPSEIAELKFGLQPISALVRRGHCLRVAIAGADKDSFARIPAQGTPTIRVQRNRVYASRIDLPVRIASKGEDHVG